MKEINEITVHLKVTLAFLILILQLVNLLVFACDCCLLIGDLEWNFLYTC